MKATHKLPTGKYYGTEVKFDLGDGDIAKFTVWKIEDSKPSQRQLEAWKAENENFEIGEMLSDSHFESETAFNICQEICRRFNRGTE